MSLTLSIEIPLAQHTLISLNIELRRDVVENRERLRENLNVLCEICATNTIVDDRGFTHKTSIQVDREDENVLISN